MSSDSAEASPPSPNTAAPKEKPSKQAVHPLAKMLADLMSPMSLKDQESANCWCTVMICGSLVVSFPVAYWLQNLFIVMFSIAGAAAVSLVVCVPNWRRRPDRSLKFADDRSVWDYYQELKKARAEASSPSAVSATKKAD